MRQHSTYRAVSALAILATLTLTACGQAATTGRTLATPTTSAAANAPTEPPAATVAAPTVPTPAAQGNAMTTPSGLQYIELAAGDGPAPQPGDIVSVHYTGTLTDGTVFDSSYKRGEPIKFPLGRGRVIRGWDEGIALMKKGGKARLIIPPQLGYGAQGAGGVIPPNATLVFEVELVDIQASKVSGPTKVDEAKYVTTPSGLKYYDIKVGDGASPAKGQKVKVHYSGWLTDGTLFDSSVERGQPFSFTLGAGEVIPGWDEGVATMKVGGKRQLVIPPSLGYGAQGAGGVIPPNATLIFEVELLPSP